MLRKIVRGTIFYWFGYHLMVLAAVWSGVWQWANAEAFVMSMFFAAVLAGLAAFEHLLTKH